MTSDDLTGKHVWFHDAECAVCDRFARWMARRDRQDRIRIALMQTRFGREELLRRGVSPAELDAGEADPRNYKTAYVVANYGTPQERLLHHGRGSAFIFSQLGGAAAVLGRIGLKLPNWLLDPPYRFFNRQRYAWFGHKDVCALPTPELRERLISH
jgi:predicted DCC family thiol-disulfide oxidoreductase YuxK